MAEVDLTHLNRISMHESIGGVPDDLLVLIMAGEEDTLARRDEAETLFNWVRSAWRVADVPEGGAPWQDGDRTGTKPPVGARLHGAILCPGVAIGSGELFVPILC